MTRNTPGHRLVLCFALAVAVGVGRASGAYLVVLSDGGFFHVETVALTGNDHLRLVLSQGAWVELPLSRVERVQEIEAEPTSKGSDHREDQLEAKQPPPCQADFASQTLPMGTPFHREILAAARRHNLDPRLLAAVVAEESGFNPFAVSKAGARGLMQLMPGVWLAHGILDPHQVEPNLNAGAAHLRKLIDRFSRLEWALAAYNAGAAVVEAYGGVPPFRETREYVARVIARWCSR